MKSRYPHALTAGSTDPSPAILQLGPAALPTKAAAGPRQLLLGRRRRAAGAWAGRRSDDAEPLPAKVLPSLPAPLKGLPLMPGTLWPPGFTPNQVSLGRQMQPGSSTQPKRNHLPRGRTASTAFLEPCRLGHSITHLVTGAQTVIFQALGLAAGCSKFITTNYFSGQGKKKKKEKEFALRIHRLHSHWKWGNTQKSGIPD